MNSVHGNTLVYIHERLHTWKYVTSIQPNNSFYTWRQTTDHIYGNKNTKSQAVLLLDSVSSHSRKRIQTSNEGVIVAKE